MKKPQYATIEQAQRLKEAGFDKQCVHEAFFGDKQIIIFAYDNTIEELDNNTPLNDVILPLPTLGEIDLPENFAIYGEKGGYMITCLLDANVDCAIFESDMPKKFETELEARIEAYIWAKENLAIYKERKKPASHFYLPTTE